jgi:hypothetical protein
MFPIISSLRRSAMKLIYTDSPEIDFIGNHFAFDVGSKTWVQAKTVQMFEASVSSDRPQERAVKLCVFENELYEAAGLSDVKYSLLVGPEEEDGDRRCFRFMILKGIVMTRDNKISKRRPAPLKRRNRAPLPKGTVVDER